VNLVSNVTLVTSACDVVSTAYVSTKESHPYIRSVCEAAEQGVKSVTEATATCVQPVLTTLKPQVAVANEHAFKPLDKLGEKLPLLQKSMDQVRTKGYALLGWKGDGSEVGLHKDRITS
ncbi:PLIN3 protein, partial [Dromaius novaehollandiae]|nr:PLIN3 protein [Dromaius novaehollandiae]